MRLALLLLALVAGCSSYQKPTGAEITRCLMCAGRCIQQCAPVCTPKPKTPQ